MKKAITADAAPAENQPQSEAVLNGENAPAIQAAQPPTASTQPPTPVAAAPHPASNVPEVKQVETPAALKEQPATETTAAKPAPSFGNLFKPFTMGATLRQDPQTGRNVMAGIVPPKQDYVKNAENKGNVKLSAEQLAKPTKKA